MTIEQIMLVKKTGRVFRGISPGTIGDLFYSKLFTDDPALRKIFPADMRQQHQKLTDMLNSIALQLDKLNKADDDTSTAAHHCIPPAAAQIINYRSVGVALLWTLQKGLGEDWNDEVRNAWAACYKLLAYIIIKSTSPV